MLRKLPEIEIKPDSPFANDVLERKESIEILTRLIESTRQPFVLSVEAPWGFGKTTFLKLWKTHLETQQHVCFCFNAWENDFVDDPLTAFLGEMNKFLEDVLKDEKQGQPIKADWEKVKRIGAGVLRKTLPLAIQIATHGLLSQKAIKEGIEAVGGDADKIEEFASTLAKERLDKYEAEKKGIAAFRESLEKLASEITEAKDKRPPLIFFVDELDRCRPDFAIALLERIKHLFNVKNVVFVLAIDREQLEQSIKTLYGAGMEPDGYLRRFIDLSYRLPQPPPEMFARSLFNRFSLSEIGTWYNLIESFVRSFAEFAEALHLSFRTQEQCFTEMNIALRNNPMIRRFPCVLSFFSTLKAFRPNVFEELRDNRLKVGDVLTWIPNVSREYKVQAEAALLIHLANENRSALERFRQVRTLTSPSIVQSADANTLNLAKEIQQVLHDLEEGWAPNAATCIFSLLNLSTGFR